MRKRSDQIFKNVIEPAVKKFGYEAIRADHIARPGLITSQVIEHLIEDELVIADLTDRNPNVFYELAIRHGVRKPFIQIKEIADTIPFDVTGMRTIDVDYRFVDSMEKCRDEIIRQIQTIESDKPEVESPITFTQNVMSVRHDNNAQTKVIMDLVSQVQALKSELEKVKEYVRASGPRIAPLGLQSFGLESVPLLKLSEVPKLKIEKDEVAGFKVVTITDESKLEGNEKKSASKPQDS